MMKKYKGIIITIMMFIIISLTNVCYASEFNTQYNPNRSVVVSSINTILKDSCYYTGGSVKIEKDDTLYEIRYGNNKEYRARFKITKVDDSYVGNINFEILENKIPENEGSGDLTDPIGNPDFYKPTDATGDNTHFISIGRTIIAIMQTVGTVIAVIMIMVLGLKYMMGTVEEKAAYKQTMIPYLIGAVMLFTIPRIMGIIYELVQGINM